LHLNFDSSEALDRPLWDSDVGSCWAGMTRVEEDADPVGKFPKVTQFLLTPVGEPSQGSEPNRQTTSVGPNDADSAFAFVRRRVKCSQIRPSRTLNPS